MSPKAFQTKEQLTEALFRRYRQAMMALAMSFMGNAHDADDVVQMAILKIMRNIDKIDDIDSPRCKHFILVITKNTALNEISRNKNRKTVTITPAEMVSIIEPGFDSYTFGAKYGFGEELSEFLGQLKEVDRDILCLKYGDDYSNAEIGEILDITEEAVRKRLSRARKRLGEIMEKGGESCRE